MKIYWARYENSLTPYYYVVEYHINSHYSQVKKLSLVLVIHLKQPPISRSFFRTLSGVLIDTHSLFKLDFHFWDGNRQCFPQCKF